MVRFCWFNLMPWPDLPDDFRESNRSVWVDIDSRLFDPERANEVYHTYMDQLEFADELGFDGIGVNEHHQNGYGIMPSPNIIAAGLARGMSAEALLKFYEETGPAMFDKQFILKRWNALYKSKPVATQPESDEEVLIYLDENAAKNLH